MKHLIYREFYLSRKTMIIDSVSAILLYIFLLLIALSARYGNVAKYNDPESIRELMEFFPKLCAVVFAVLAIACEGVLNLIYADYSSGWNKYIKTTGLRAEVYIGAKYITVMIWFLFSLLLGCGMSFSMKLICGGVFPAIRLIVQAGAAVFILMSYLIPVALFVKKREAVLIPIIIPYFVLLAVFLVLIHLNRDHITGLIGCLSFVVKRCEGMPFIAAVCWPVSYFVSVKLFKRSE